MSIKERYRGFKPLPTDIQQRIESLPLLLEKEGVSLMYLFGSLVKLNYGEDVDLAVLHQEELDQLRILLKEVYKSFIKGLDVFPTFMREVIQWLENL